MMQTLQKCIKGSISIYKGDELLYNFPNALTYSGCDFLAKALIGAENATISHLYVGYTNDVVPSTEPPFTISNTPDMKQYGDVSDLMKGCLRIPLLKTPTIYKETGEVNYSGNIVEYTSLITSDASRIITSGNNAFANGSKIFELALVCAINPGVSADDLIFTRSRIRNNANVLSNIVFDDTIPFSLVWPIKIIA